MENLVQTILETGARFRAETQTPVAALGKKLTFVEEFNRVAGRPGRYEVLCFGTQMPLQFEQLHGLKGVAGHYVFPLPLKAIDVELYVKLQLGRFQAGLLPERDWHEQLTAVARMLLDENPALKDLPFNPAKRQDLYDLILGVTSDFNKDDIRFFLSLPQPRGASAKNDPEYERLYDIVNDRIRLRWVPSPETLKTIGGQLQDRESAAKAAPCVPRPPRRD